MWQATGEVGSKIPTMGEIRSGGFGQEGWSEEGQMERRGHNPHDIHRRRLSRTTSTSGRTRTSTMTPTPGALGECDERQEFFPTYQDNQTALEADRVPSTIKEASHFDTKESGSYFNLCFAISRLVLTISNRSAPETAQRPIEALATTENAASSSSSTGEKQPIGPDETGTYPNGYRFPKKHTWGQSTVIGLKAFWKFTCTPFGFLITLYGLNVVGWGAMIFFVLLEAAPAMCHPSCGDDSSACQKWIEYDSQILNALFCVTGFGLIPWRFRDFYYLMRWRLKGETLYMRKLAGINRGWFRLAGSDKLPETMGPPPVYTKKNPNPYPDAPPPYSETEIDELEANPAVPMPVSSMPTPPLTGIRAPPSKTWTIDVVVWMYMLNTAFQACLAGFMWGMNRFNRPSWATGFFISIGCVVAIVAGIVVFIEGKKIKKVEGIPVHEYDIFDDIESAADLKEPNEVKKEVKEDGKDGAALRPTLSRTTTHKTKGKEWYARN